MRATTSSAALSWLGPALQRTARSLAPPLLGLSLGLALLSAATEAQAYCRTSVCDATFESTLCVPSQPVDCGIPLYWNRNCFGMSLQEDASNQVELETVRSIMQVALASWQAADCGGGAHPGIRVQLDDDVECSHVEYNQSGGNANVITFRDKFWPHEGMGNSLALTTVTYNLDTAEIYDADIEVNSTPTVEITVTDTDVKIDLLSVLTHEVGHVFGLAHSEDEDATMFDTYMPSDTTIRELADDDITAICVAYPPKDITSCDIEPRHGFKSTCGPEEDVESDCSCTVAANKRGSGGLAVWLLLGGLALGRRKRQRRPM